MLRLRLIFSIELGLLIVSGKFNSLLVAKTGLILAFFKSCASGNNFFGGSLLTICLGDSFIKRF